MQGRFQRSRQHRRFQHTKPYSGLRGQQNTTRVDGKRDEPACADTSRWTDPAPAQRREACWLQAKRASTNVAPQSPGDTHASAPATRSSITGTRRNCCTDRELRIHDFHHLLEHCLGIVTCSTVLLVRGGLALDLGAHRNALETQSMSARLLDTSERHKQHDTFEEHTTDQMATEWQRADNGMPCGNQMHEWEIAVTCQFITHTDTSK